MVTKRRFVILPIALVLLLGACSSSSDDADGTDEPTVSEILISSATAMSGIDSASFTIEQSGASIFIDDADQLGFQSAEGRFAAPASSEALVTVNAFGFTAEVGAIAIGGDLWFTDPLTGDWTEAPDDFTFDPATLFDAAVGLPVLLIEAAPSAELIDDAAGEAVGAGDRHHIRTTVSAERVSVLTGGLVATEAEVDLWIDAATGRVAELQFDLLIGDQVSTWKVAISDYNADVIITAPELGATG